ncbi:Exported pilin protein [Yersinia mollaretii ATCC 43969]|uniref:Exported pilin protein n=1 Tax=Yersinia mollaretii (strain ATCC 43969 / DSM 18520 / CIP 103324 / CNY 7263 / WAIP 204) TaxID=349967 RepID=A0ABM9YAK6_YERMW|nr:Exported pilin protein [Yersinia mollaretii ATCC 43969]
MLLLLITQGGAAKILTVTLTVATLFSAHAELLNNVVAPMKAIITIGASRIAVL